MKKMMHLVLAATLICGASVFTSCSESSDNPAPENAKNRKEFIKRSGECEEPQGVYQAHPREPEGFGREPELRFVELCQQR